MLTQEQHKKKRRLVHIVIAVCLLLIPLLVYEQHKLLSSNLPLKITDTILIFALININALLLLLMLYMVLRNLAELAFAQKHQLFGFRLRTKLVLSFLALSFLPTTLLFLFAFGSISATMDYWFNSKVEESLQASVNLAQSVFADNNKQIKFINMQLAALMEKKLADPLDVGAVESLFRKMLVDGDNGAPDVIMLLNASQQEVFMLRSSRMLPIVLPPVPSGALRKVALTKTIEVVPLHSSAGEIVQAISPIELKSIKPQTWFLVTSLLIPAPKLAEMRSIQDGLSGYQHQVLIKSPMKLSVNLLLSIVTLLLLFASIWLGLYIAKTLTNPINELALATHRVAEGDLDFVLARPSDDEMGILVDSFNAMTAGLRASNQELAKAHHALQESNVISEQRRNYLETILEHVAAGVISLDEEGNIRTINRFAEDLLAIDTDRLVGHNFRDVMPRHHAMIVEGFLDELMCTGKAVVERHLRLTIRRGEVLSLQINVARMVVDEQKQVGFVIVFDDLTNLEQAQRLAAWQEVARRIAHEIKNPLTPIQLSAQRLRKKYLPDLTKDKEVFDQCISTIINQVGELRRMTEEFSDFARMPKLNKKRDDLVALVKEVVALYRQAYLPLEVSCELDEMVPQFSFDAVQIKRVLINLLDNAVSAQEDSQGKIEVRLGLNKEEDKVFLQVADKGPGISQEFRLRIFEPYFSTRKTGTGLGLAICQTIAKEHNGTIQVADNVPTGAIFTMELPIV